MSSSTRREVVVGIAGRMQVEREDRCRAARQVVAGQRVPGARLEAGVVDARDGRVLLAGTAPPASRAARCDAPSRRSRVSRPCSSWKALNADSEGPRSWTYLVLTSAM